MRRIPRSAIIAVLVTGLTVAAAIGVIGWRYIRPYINTITVTAQFESVSGLYVNNPVSVLGMPVGRVAAINLKGSYAEVELAIDKSVKIPVNAQAVTVSTSILTDRHIELTPPYRGGPTLNEHDTIGLSNTRSPIEFDRVLGILDKLSGSLRGNGKGQGPVADLVNNSAAIADGNGEQMKSAADALSKALRISSADGGALTREQLTTIITNTSSLFEAAAKNDQTLRDFGSSVRQLSQIVADENLGSGSTGHTLNTIIEKAGTIVEKNRDNFKQSIQHGNSALQSLTDYQREASELFDVLPLMSDNLYNAIDQNNGSIRAHILVDKIIFDSQFGKEICNLMGLRQLGCSTGTLQDYGPDFGLTYMLDGLAAMGQK
ncbi:mammalian cell entry protein [Mycobacteroides franklinii]|uniref:Mammalian cell entry protein n=1 Tax=Mycobacteroides franklinii TaxID=948102 RepID=A0A1S1LAX1_9MYCO|nr:MCE family protein [Mycobacteroides franklinii]OHU21260.1 mammalian cell entry protein [Mycobacteroides franklinii]